MPVFGRSSGSSQHVFDFADAVIGECGDGLVGAGVDADDVAVGPGSDGFGVRLGV